MPTAIPAVDRPPPRFKHDDKVCWAKSHWPNNPIYVEYARWNADCHQWEYHLDRISDFVPETELTPDSRP